jgi:hypothetical protein
VPDDQDEVTDDDAEVLEDDDGVVDVEPGAASSSATTRKGLVLAGVLVLGLVIGRVTAPGDDGGDGNGETAAEDGGGIPFPSGDADRTNYWGLAGLVPVVNDPFDRADADTLGTAPTGQVWETVDGSWAVEGRNAAFGGTAGEGQALAIAPTPETTGPGLFEVTLNSPANGTGLVFRYLDRDNYWTVTARPNVGIWTITKVADGQPQVAGEFEGAAEDGVTVTVIQNQATLRFLLDGEDVFILTDTSLSEQLQGGLVARGQAPGATRWDRFMVMDFSNAPGS